MGASGLIKTNISISAGADFFGRFRFEEVLENGGREGVDISSWKGYMAFAKGSTKVLQCDECLILGSDGYVNVHIPAKTTLALKRGSYDYNIVLQTDEGYVVSFVEGLATVSEIIPEVDYDAKPEPTTD